MMIDLNADVGEGFPLDEALMRSISSCNIACGGHAGDRDSMRSTIVLAQQYGVSIGAHPSYPDRANFGRVALNVDSVALYQALVEQLQQFLDMTAALGATMFHIKPHGALYNVAAYDQATAAVLIAVIRDVAPNAVLLALAHSPLITLAQQQGIKVASEAFIDRAYTTERTLVSRQQAGAVHHDPQVALRQALAIAQHREFPSINGSAVVVQAQSLCVHGDTPEALSFVRSVHDHFTQHEIKVASLSQTLGLGDVT